MKKKNAYFTVEAALVLPVVMAVMLLAVYMMLFQYNRCLLEQDLGAMALWGSSVEASGTKDMEEKINGRMEMLYRDKYAAWEITAMDVVLEKKCFTAKAAGRLTFPVPGWNFWSAENIWGMEAQYSYNRLSPATFIRLCRKLDAWREENHDAER